MAHEGLTLTGFHHLTAVTARASDNVDFYTGVLGLRLVKKTVNQDDVSAYHLYYADALGNPGTDITFFDWPVGPERRGTRSAVRTGLRVESQSVLNAWQERFHERGVRQSSIVERDGRWTLDFEDREGQRLALVVDPTPGNARAWDRSPVPADQQLRGLGPITISVPDLRQTHRQLTEVLNMKEVRTYEVTAERRVTVHVYQMGGGGAAAELHVAVEPGAPAVRQGAGGVHHIALRTPNDEQYEAWEERLDALGVSSSGPVDRYYFKSLYFSDPSGILFEIATDGPGFAADESPETLGESLALPPFLEPRRREIEAGLKPIGPAAGRA